MGVRIGVDIDGVLRDWDGALLNMVKTYYPDRLLSEKSTSWGLNHIDLPIEYLRYLFAVKHVYEVYYHAKPYDDAILGFSMLKTFADVCGHKLICVSHQWDDTIPPTLGWLGLHGIEFEEIHFTEEKHEVNIDYLIDDSPSNYEKWVESGRKESSFIIFTRNYNHDCVATNRVSKLTDAIKYIK